LPVAEMAPMEAKAVESATRARTQTDVNNDEFDDSDFPTISDAFPLLNFSGRSQIFNNHAPIAPTQVFSATSGMGV